MAAKNGTNGLTVGGDTIPNGPSYRAWSTVSEKFANQDEWNYISSLAAPASAIRLVDSAKRAARESLKPANGGGGGVPDTSVSKELWARCQQWCQTQWA
ncbi:MAG: hypothetical protein LBE74_07920 [Treponema sp.]|jgi:hypothetical protein|nr:hypothetical protein [Treponema sp.]